MTEERHIHLEVRVGGALADQNRIALNELITLGTVLQSSVRGVGAVLSGGRAGVSGRKKGDVEAATELHLVGAPRPGSVALDLELAPEPEAIPGIGQSGLGERALRALVQGIASLDDAQDELLPEGFDPGLLRTLDRLGPVLRKGYEIAFALSGTAAPPARAHVDHRWLAAVERLIARPLRAHLTLEGVLQMVDLAARPLQCRIDRSYLPSVMCLIPSEREDEVRAALGRRVRIEGEGEFDGGANDPKRVMVERLEVVTEVAGIDPDRIHEHAPWQELAASQDVGVLHDPTELAGLFEDDGELDEFLASTRGASDTSLA